MRPLRVFGFFIAYFLLFCLLITLPLVEIALRLYPELFMWYLQHPLELALLVIAEISPLFVVTILQFVIMSLALGLATEWIYAYIKRHSKREVKICRS